MKRLGPGLGFALVFLLGACGAEPAADNGNGEGTAQVQWVDLGDGTEVRCVMWWDGYRGGASCDWDNVRPKSYS